VARQLVAVVVLALLELFQVAEMEEYPQYLAQVFIMAAAAVVENYQELQLLAAWAAAARVALLEVVVAQLALRILVAVVEAKELVQVHLPLAVQA
jgi:hypothetical protein